MTEFRDWKQAFTAVIERWPKGEVPLIVLDEFQWMVQSAPELPSILQQLWDRHWQHQGQVKLIVCGSFIGFMERSVLVYKSQLSFFALCMILEHFVCNGTELV